MEYFLFVHYFEVCESKMYAINITGIAALICAGFFGFMLALLQRRVRDMFSSNEVSITVTSWKTFIFQKYLWF